MKYLVAILVLAIAATASDVSLPLTFCRDRKSMTVITTVNGKSRRFLIDTGSEMTIVSKETVNMNLVELRKARFAQSGPGMLGEAIIMRVDLKLGTNSWSQAPVMVMDLQYVQDLYGKDIDGLLGQDVLSQFSSVTVDFKNRQLVLTN
jgi:predicted aspartyl protease